MAIRYHFDLYPANNPKSGARQVRFTQLQSAEYRGEANGTGSGKLSLRGSTTDAGFIDPTGNQYVRVVREDTDAATFLVVGGFFLEHGDFEALTEKGTKLLTFGGAGTLAYLDRAIMWSHTYYSHSIDSTLGTAYGQDPFDDIWRLSSAGTGTTHGAMLWRAIYEATHFPSAAYEHEHGDGEVYTDTHVDDRTANVLSALVYNFTKTADTAGNAWSTSSGEFHVPVGETLLQVVKRLMEAGLYIDMNPDTFELRAWEGANHGRTRTGVAWGANIIRFQAPTDGTIATGNIKSDAKRGLAARIRRSVVLAGGSDVYGRATSASNVPWEGFYPAETESATVNAQLASTQLTARNEAGDTARLRFKLGTDPANGSYLPFEHILPDDLATLHSGTGSWDWNEAALPVAALTINVRPGSDWDAFVDLGSTYTDMRSRAFADSLRQIIRQPGSHTHPPDPQLCRAATAGGTSNFLLGLLNSVLKGSGTASGTLEVAVNGDLTDEWSTNGFPVSDQWWAADVGSTAKTPQSARIIQGGGTGNQASDVILWGTNDDAKWAGLTSTYDFSANGWTQLATFSGLGLGDSGTLTVTGASSYRYFAFDPSAGGANGWSVREFELHGPSTSADPRDGHADLVGTGSRASRCDHAHHVLRTTNPTVNDDTNDGYPVTTLWTNTATGNSFLLTDNTAGAAVWDAFGGIGSSTLDDLTDVTITSAVTGDMLRYNGTAWVNTPGRWEPVTNGDVTTPEIVFDAGDVVMEWKP